MSDTTVRTAPRALGVSDVQWGPVIAGAIAAAALATVLSATVTCSDGCPLPPFERATVADLVHATETWVDRLQR